ERSTLFADDTWWGVPGDYMVEADVEYFDILPARWFTDVTDSLGISTGGRLAWGDYDGDGDDDLLMSGGTLLRNDGAWAFTDVSAEAGIGGMGTNGGLWADYDNDGHLDFFAMSGAFAPPCETDADCYRAAASVPGIGDCAEISDHVCHPALKRCALPGTESLPHDRLYHNEGDGTFTEVSEAAGGPYDYWPTEGAGWADYDRDGFVDLYMANYETPTQWAGCQLSVGTPDSLWRNNGDGTFSDVSGATGVHAGFIWCGRGVNWGDFDDDGDADVFVSNYRLNPNLLWINRGDGTFQNMAQALGVEGIPENGAYGHTIGSEWGDVDNDGDLDLFSANLAHPRFIEFSDKSMMLMNRGAEAGWTFENTFFAAGFKYEETHSEPSFGDFDNDGDLDLHITSVYVGRKSHFYMNLGRGTFGFANYPSGLVVDNGWGAAWADVDGDGDLDFVSNRIFRNDYDQVLPRGRWLRLRLEGTVSNRAAIGARIVAEAGDLLLLREVSGGKGTTNQSSLVQHLGLGDRDRVDQVEIRWPSGTVQTFGPLAADQVVHVLEGALPAFLSPPGSPEDAGPGPDAAADARVGADTPLAEAGTGGDLSAAEPAGGHGSSAKGCATGPSGGSALMLPVLAGLLWSIRRRFSLKTGRAPL
ncbi:MAG: CRTAC1 family protein, partial [Deltaproteobacteria bacterium]|nr:CRTAC1 family protein [Deltaproteobacteria bacterium]